MSPRRNRNNNTNLLLHSTNSFVDRNLHTSNNHLNLDNTLARRHHNSSSSHASRALVAPTVFLGNLVLYPDMAWALVVHLHQVMAWEWECSMARRQATSRLGHQEDSKANSQLVLQDTQ
jgi:hypothetical protein